MHSVIHGVAVDVCSIGGALHFQHIQFAGVKVPWCFMDTILNVIMRTVSGDAVELLLAGRAGHMRSPMIMQLLYLLSMNNNNKYKQTFWFVSTSNLSLL